MEHKSSNHSKVHHLKLLLWLACGSLTMSFAAFTSAYIVQKSSSYWVTIDIPMGFIYNIGTALFISVAIHLASKAIKEEKASQFLAYLGFAFVLMLAFAALQYMAYQELIAQDVYLLNEESQAGPFLYVISLFHLCHVVLGLGFMIALAILFKKKGVTEQNKLRSELCATYLHFMGGVWIFLSIFFVINH